ncbi:hypothetical protein SAMN06296416_102550 [Pseudoxanthomonas wuyuanensis]|uniref:Uncharacterized protein n=2 Tax=Pseudoxanthomonas wuyuanensis TaxID=1073196 RepID=A0A286D4X7_9GAMM|nr:hypothetical protein SAMN06296416_102550 [Pseudoxanthomonas wuyuanensis]
MQFLQQIWAVLSDFANSAFASASLSALAGAGLGVWGAQRVAERGARGKELLESLRQANAVIVLATTIANHAFALKRQHISPLSQRYFKDRDIALAYHASILNGGSPKPISFQAEMTKITPVTIPLDALKNLVYSAQLMPGRALALVAIVEQSVCELTNAIEMRTEQIDTFRSAALPEHIFFQDYYGLQRRDGDTNSMYHDSMVSITQYTDDLGFFSTELADEMQTHAGLVRDKLLKFRKDVPKVSTVDFSPARESGLIPPRENYESWLSGFKKQDQ